MTIIKRLYLQEKLYPEFMRHVKITRMVMHVNLVECPDAILYIISHLVILLLWILLKTLFH